MSEWTKERIKKLKTLAGNALPAPFGLQGVGRGHRILAGDKHQRIADLSGIKHQENGEYLVAAANELQNALNEIEYLQSELQKAKDEKGENDWLAEESFPNTIAHGGEAIKKLQDEVNRLLNLELLITECGFEVKVVLGRECLYRQGVEYYPERKD